MDEIFSEKAVSFLATAIIEAAPPGATLVNYFTDQGEFYCIFLQESASLQVYLCNRQTTIGTVSIQTSNKISEITHIWLKAGCDRPKLLTAMLIEAMAILIRKNGDILQCLHSQVVKSKTLDKAMRTLGGFNWKTALAIDLKSHTKWPTAILRRGYKHILAEHADAIKDGNTDNYIYGLAGTSHRNKAHFIVTFNGEDDDTIDYIYLGYKNCKIQTYVHLERKKSGRLEVNFDTLAGIDIEYFLFAAKHILVYAINSKIEDIFCYDSRYHFIVPVLIDLLSPFGFSKDGLGMRKRIQYPKPTFTLPPEMSIITQLHTARNLGFFAQGRCLTGFQGGNDLFFIRVSGSTSALIELCTATKIAASLTVQFFSITAAVVDYQEKSSYISATEYTYLLQEVMAQAVRRGNRILSFKADSFADNSKIAIAIASLGGVYTTEAWQIDLTDGTRWQTIELAIGLKELLRMADEPYASWYRDEDLILLAPAISSKPYISFLNDLPDDNATHLHVLAGEESAIFTHLLTEKKVLVASVALEPGADSAMITDTVFRILLFGFSGGHRAILINAEEYEPIPKPLVDVLSRFGFEVQSNGWKMKLTIGEAQPSPTSILTL